jgi:hypothetical protein
MLTERRSRLKKLYRGPLDWLEERTTGMADRVLVNSRFTGSDFSGYPEHEIGMVPISLKIVGKTDTNKSCYSLISVSGCAKFITSAKEVMFSPLSVFLFVRKISQKVMNEF